MEDGSIHSWGIRETGVMVSSITSSFILSLRLSFFMSLFLKYKNLILRGAGVG
jgi:hypothetical protein